MLLHTVDIANDVTVYECKDGRCRAYIKSLKCIVSYPKLLMSVHLKRELQSNEHVHHIDGNPLNNTIDNLQVIGIVEHEKLHNKVKYVYEDKLMTCPWCGKTFIWSSKQQMYWKSNCNKSKSKSANHIGPFCSRKCAGTYGAEVQNGRA